MPRFAISAIVLSLMLTSCGDTGVDRQLEPSTPSFGARAPDAANTDADGACDCDPDQHCDADGACLPDVCYQGSLTCETSDLVKVCSPTGESFQLKPCAATEVCETGVCVPRICQPGTDVRCEAGRRVACNSLGSGWVQLPCPETHVCKEGECLAVQPNVLLLVDTSFSMNQLVDSDQMAGGCDPAFGSCPPWTWPDCDHPDEPLTRIGVVKTLISELAEAGETNGLRLALQRFPQRHGVIGGCSEGYYRALDTITGDDDVHDTTDAAWFEAHLGDSVVVPFDENGDASADAIQAWCDFDEVVSASGLDCTVNEECPGGICQFGGCFEHTSPELRAMGQTPLGKSLFYAGEYLRRAIFVEGKPCEQSEDCGSPHHSCVEGACHDALGKCRSTRIIVLSDGVESANHELNDFFHPRVQAKRLHYGLGCFEDEDCVSGATCSSGLCQPPPGEVEDNVKACSIFEIGCDVDTDCPDYNCGQGELCSGQCQKSAVTYDDGGAGDRLTDASGAPVSVTVHIIDACGIAGANRFIAQYGGGEHINVNLADASAIVATVLPLLDVKAAAGGNVCDLEQ